MGNPTSNVAVGETGGNTRGVRDGWTLRAGGGPPPNFPADGQHFGGAVASSNGHGTVVEGGAWLPPGRAGVTLTPNPQTLAAMAAQQQQQMRQVIITPGIVQPGQHPGGPHGPQYITVPAYTTVPGARGPGGAWTPGGTVPGGMPGGMVVSSGGIVPVPPGEQHKGGGGGKSKSPSDSLLLQNLPEHLRAVPQWSPLLVDIYCLRWDRGL